MKPAAAFAAGLWTGALVMAAVGIVYLHISERGRTAPAAPGHEPLEVRLQLLQQEQAKAAAEVQRLRQAVTELRAPPVRSTRSPRARNGEVAAWIIESVLQADPPAVAKLERAALQNNLAALDALALLAELDHAAALTRVWASPALDVTSKERATLLLASTLEANPRGEELLVGLAAQPALVEPVVAGLVAPEFPSRLLRGTGIPAPPVKPDYALRLRIADSLRQAVTDELLLATIDLGRAELTHRATAAP